MTLVIIKIRSPMFSACSQSDHMSTYTDMAVYALLASRSCVSTSFDIYMSGMIDGGIKYQ